MAAPTLFAISAVGRDQPGIVAAVTGVLVEQGCNLEDTEMAVLRGHFAMMMLVAGHSSLSAGDLEKALASTAANFDLLVAVRQVDITAVDPTPGSPWSVSVYGADRPGILHDVTAQLSEHGVNVTGVETRLVGHPGRAVYVMLLDVTVPPTADGDAVAAALAELGGRLGVECTMRAADADVL
jgi:glycine cleavage system transcriptional repressor